MKNLFKKTLLLVLGFVMVFALASCKSDDEAAEEADSTDYSHTILFYSTQGDSLQTITQTAIDKFETANPGWTVEHTQPGGYDEVKDQIIADLQAGTQPDLAYCYADHVAAYIQTRKVVDMKSLISSTFTTAEIADFVPGYYSEGIASNFGGYSTYGYAADGMLTLPFSKSTELMYVNLDILEGAGVVDESGNVKIPTTWDELWTACEKVADKYPKVTPLGYDSEANWFITMCQQNGWGYTTANGESNYLFNNSNTIAWLEDLAEYYEKGYIMTQTEYGSYTSNVFTTGKVDGVADADVTGLAFCIGSSGGASYQYSDTFNWDVVAIPGSKQADDTVNYSVISQGPSLCMFYTDRSSNKDEKAQMTMKFVKYLMEAEFQASFSMASGYNPVVQSASDVAIYASFLQGLDSSGNELTAAKSMTSKAAAVASTLTNKFFTSPAFLGSSTARVQVGNALVAALTGTKTAQKALRDAYYNCGGK